jgi:carbonic anhydrase
MNIKQELKNNIRWIALKSGKTNKQVMDDIKKFKKILFENDRKVKKK